MNIKTQIYVRGNPNIYRYLREYSYWYKILNRNPNSFRYFVDDMRVKYKLTTSDRIDKAINNISMIQSFLDVLK